MPYVPSLKTDGESQDRILIDVGVKKVAEEIVKLTKGSTKLLFAVYRKALKFIGNELFNLQVENYEGEYYSSDLNLALLDLKNVIFGVAKKYNYDGAWFGELNYAITRLIQVVPNLCVEKGYYKSALRYWLYAGTVGVLKIVSDYFSYKVVDDSDEWIKAGLVGVFIDIKDEYKRRVNTSYEAVQIIKSGDCYNTPYYTKLVEIIDQSGRIVGYQEVMIKKADDNGKDIFGKMQIVVE